MQVQHNGSVSADACAAERVPNAPVELDDLRATCRRQARVIDALTGAVMTLRSGAAALKAQNAELRDEIERLDARHGNGASQAAEPVEVRMALDVHAPAAARAAVDSALRDRVPGAVFERAQLLASELATNSVLHSGAPPGSDLVLRVEPSNTMIRLEIEDSGRGDAIVARPPQTSAAGAASD